MIQIESYYYYAIGLVIIFYLLSKLQASYLISIIIIIILAYYIDLNIKYQQSLKLKATKTSENKLKTDIKNVSEISTYNVYIKENNKDLKYLVKNNDFMSILHNIRFMKKFNKSIYNKIIMYMDKLMKIYVYILTDRYDVNSYLPIFYDIKNNILEQLYSYIFIIPETFKHTYGFEPHVEIEKSILDFIKKTNNMLSIIVNYAKIGKKQVHINAEKYRPHENGIEHILP